MRLVSVVTRTRSRCAARVADLLQQVVHLPLHRPHLDRRIHQPGRPDHLLDHHALRLRQLVGARRGRDEDHLRRARLPLLEIERAVVERRRQAEPVRHQHFLARAVAEVHAADLRHRLVALVHDQEGVVGQVVEQRRRRFAGRAPGQVPRVVLDAVAVADLAHHLEVEHRALVQPLRLEQLAFRLELPAALRELGLDRLDRQARAVARGHEVRLREHRHLVDAPEHLAGERVEPGELVHFVAEEADAERVLFVRRHDLDDVAAHAERAAAELDVVALVLNLDQLAQDVVALDALPLLQRQHHAVVGLGRAQAVDARHAGDDDDVAALEERPRGRQAHPVDLVVDRGLLLDVRVGGRHVGLGLVVVVVADEVLDGVLGEEPPELLEELRGQRLVVGHHDASGRFTSATTCAMVKVFPDPVTPSSTWWASPRFSPSISSGMAWT